MNPLYEMDAEIRAQHGIFCGVDEAGRDRKSVV